MSLCHPLTTVYTFQLPTKILFGVDSVTRIGQEAKHLGGLNALIVTDKNVERVGLTEKMKGSLTAEGFKVHLFDKVNPEPDMKTAETTAQCAREGRYDLVVGVGGGSVLDMAKTASISITNTGNVRSYIGFEQVKEPGVPLILIPTTAGTGSEVSNVVVVVMDDKVKMGIASEKVVADVAIVDPKMTASVPPRTTASTGIDALSHAIEAYMSLASSKITDVFALEAIKLIAIALPLAYTNGENLQARYDMSLGSLLAGIALTNAGTCAGHPCSDAFIAKCGAAHGVGCGIALPYIMDFNLMAIPDKLAMIAEAMGSNVSGLKPREAGVRAVIAVKELIEELGLPSTLREMNVLKDELPNLADQTLKTTYGVSSNPRRIAKEEMLNIYENMWTGKVSKY